MAFTLTIEPHNALLSSSAWAEMGPDHVEGYSALALALHIDF
jgi:hypothetical protein